MLAWELELRAPWPASPRAPLAAPVVAAGGAAPSIAEAPGSPPMLAGEPLAALLRGSGAQPRSGALAGRLLRVLSELGLIASPPSRSRSRARAAAAPSSTLGRVPRVRGARSRTGSRTWDAPDREHAPAAAPAEPAVA